MMAYAVRPGQVAKELFLMALVQEETVGLNTDRCRKSKILVLVIGAYAEFAMCTYDGWVAGSGVPLGVNLTDQIMLVLYLVPMMVVTPSMISLPYFYQVKFRRVHYHIVGQEKEVIYWLERAG